MENIDCSTGESGLIFSFSHWAKSGKEHKFFVTN
jgi:hypothetical protein